MSGPTPKPGTSPLGDKPMTNDQQKQDEATEVAESDVGEEDPGAALDSGETETVSRDDVRSSEA